jgi:HprK-related kinase B
MNHTLETVSRALIDDHELVGGDIQLCLDDCVISVRSNSTRLIDNLRRYFSHICCSGRVTDMEILAIEREAPELGVPFRDWKREPGKHGRKDSYFDLEAARLVRKVRTGMVFLQSDSLRIAAGPCVRYDNQVINFINAQYMNWLQQREWLICHAAGLVRNGKTLGIAGFSGGGKSTLMLNMLEDPTFSYLTNDRLFIRREKERIRTAGIPKLPRVNPGTIVHNPRLHPLISEEKRHSLLELPRDQLWELEEKYDVLIDQVYGRGRIVQEATLGAFMVLNWRRDSDQPTRLQQVDLAQRLDLLKAIIKSPGPFYQYVDGSFYRDDTPFDESAYLQQLEGVAIYEASGCIDFDEMTRTMDKLI